MNEVLQKYPWISLQKVQELWTKYQYAQRGISFLQFYENSLKPDSSEEKKSYILTPEPIGEVLFNGVTYASKSEEKKCCERCWVQNESQAFSAPFCGDFKCFCHKPDVPKQEHSHAGEMPGILNTVYCEECFREVSQRKMCNKIECEEHDYAEVLRPEPSFIDRKVEEFKNRRDDRNVLEWLRTALEEASRENWMVEQIYEQGRLAERKDIEEIIEKQLSLWPNQRGGVKNAVLLGILAGIRNRK